MACQKPWGELLFKGLLPSNEPLFMLSVILLLESQVPFKKVLRGSWPLLSLRPEGGAPGLGGCSLDVMSLLVF